MAPSPQLVGVSLTKFVRTIVGVFINAAAADVLSSISDSVVECITLFDTFFSALCWDFGSAGLNGESGELSIFMTSFRSSFGFISIPLANCGCNERLI